MGNPCHKEVSFGSWSQPARRNSQLVKPAKTAKPKLYYIGPKGRNAAWGPDPCQGKVVLWDIMALHWVLQGQGQVPGGANIWIQWYLLNKSRAHSTVKAHVLLCMKL